MNDSKTIVDIKHKLSENNLWKILRCKKPRKSLPVNLKPKNTGNDDVIMTLSYGKLLAVRKNQKAALRCPHLIRRIKSPLSM